MGRQLQGEPSLQLSPSLKRGLAQGWCLQLSITRHLRALLCVQPVPGARGWKEDVSPHCERQLGGTVSI